LELAQKIYEEALSEKYDRTSKYERYLRNNIAGVYLIMGNLSKAKNVLDEVKQLLNDFDKKNKGIKNILEQAFFYNNYGILELLLGNVKDARVQMKAAQNCFLDTFTGCENNVMLAISLVNLANSSFCDKEYDESLNYYVDALKVYRSLFSLKHPHCGVIFSRILDMLEFPGTGLQPKIFNEMSKFLGISQDGNLKEEDQTQFLRERLFERQNAHPNSKSVKYIYLNLI